METNLNQETSDYKVRARASLRHVLSKPHPGQTECVAVIVTCTMIAISNVVLFAHAMIVDTFSIYIAHVAYFA